MKLLESRYLDSSKLYPKRRKNPSKKRKRIGKFVLSTLANDHHKISMKMSMETLSMRKTIRFENEEAGACQRG
jgi:hypothetical protein